MLGVVVFEVVVLGVVVLGVVVLGVVVVDVVDVDVVDVWVVVVPAWGFSVVPVAATAAATPKGMAIAAATRPAVAERFR